jgi:prolyl-tRNA editing enzyme YbaK/EbsC (Cys-tRNA(Pro) deacylase)
MKQQLPPSAQRVQSYLEENGFHCKVQELNSSTRTAQEAADSVGCHVAQIAKSLIFKDKKAQVPLLIIASGANRVDTRKVEKAIGTKLGRADGNYVKEQVGYAIGGVPPVAHAKTLRTFVDQDLKNHDTIWAAAGTPSTLFEINPSDLLQASGGQWLDVAEEK